VQEISLSDKTKTQSAEQFWTCGFRDHREQTMGEERRPPNQTRLRILVHRNFGKQH